MKKTTKILLMITFFLLLLAGCAEKINFEAQLAGKWYSEGSQEAAFILYDDGTCEISGEYGTGTWSVVNDNQLKLTNFYGETETSTVEYFFELYPALITVNSQLASLLVS